MVSKEELFERVWQGVAVTDNALTRAVKDLRRAIGDDARRPKYVETASRRGYRFVADLRDVPQASQVSLLILPFDDLSAAPSAHLTDGLVDELIAGLGRINPDRLTVIGHASAMAAGAANRPWADLGRDLNVDYVVQGTVRRDDRRVQVSIRLGRVAGQQAVSTRAFEASLADAAGVHAHLAESIATQVHVQLAEGTPVPTPAIDPDAHATLLEGRHFLRQRTAEAVRKAKAAFERALAHAPDLARAHVGLAHCHAFFLMGTGRRDEASTEALAAVTRALEIDDRLADAHAVLAVLQCAEWRFVDAERSLRWAVALDPASPQARHWLAMFPLAVSGRYRSAPHACTSIHTSRAPTSTSGWRAPRWAGTRRRSSRSKPRHGSMRARGRRPGSARPTARLAAPRRRARCSRR